MTKKSRRYSAEYRRRLIELTRGGRTPEELSREFEPSAQAIRNWVAAADREEGRVDGWTEKERRELRKAKREIRRLREEREILKKAAAWFARETVTRWRSRSSPPWNASCWTAPVRRHLKLVRRRHLKLVHPGDRSRKEAR